MKGFQLNLGLVTTIVELAIPIVFEFDAVTCRYVQFLATKLYSVPSSADGYLCQVAEIEVFAA